VAATFAELEAEIKRQNTREGIAAQRNMGKWYGRPPFSFDVVLRGISARMIASRQQSSSSTNLIREQVSVRLPASTGVSRSTIQEIAANRQRYAGEQFEKKEDRASVGNDAAHG
jgi:DNA invertase Pin-like site-specific DNA recombinase